MEEDKTKVVLLGADTKLLKNVAERVNKTRPADVTIFYNLKSFLEYSIEHQPDLVGVSVGFPHPSTAKFPKVFKMALNVPVLVFGENQDSKTRKLLSTSSSDFKISGVVTAHNLWMKILNFQNMKKEALKAAAESGEDVAQSEEMSNSVFLKGGGNNSQVEGGKNKLLSNLFAALGGADDDAGKSNMNVVSSGEATKFKKSGASHLNSNSSSNPNSSSNGIAHMGGTDTAGDLKKSNMNHVKSESSASKPKPTTTAHVSNTEKSYDTYNDEPEFEGGQSGPSEETKKDLEFAMGGVPKNGLNQNAEQELDSAYDKNKKENQEHANNPDSENRTDASDDNFEETSSKNDKAPIAAQGPSFEKNKSSDGQNSLGEQNNKGSESPYGKVQLSDEKEVKEQAEKKSKEKTAQENSKKKNVLKIASEKALEINYFASSILEAREYRATHLAVFTVNMGSFMGYLILSNSFNHDYDLQELEDFRAELVKNLQEHGVFGELSLPYLLKVDVEAYDQVISEFTEFNVNHEDETAKQFNVAFVQREVVTPVFSESDKRDMFLVDIKVIPPQTPVNFDAFIYLPINQRFVRYLKDGRSLSLKQAKRHSEEPDGQSKLLLPKDHKRKFEQFFIQNTLNWEFALHAKKEEAA